MDEKRDLFETAIRNILFVNDFNTKLNINFKENLILIIAPDAQNACALVA